jgi:hypothetical protein
MNSRSLKLSGLSVWVAFMRCGQYDKGELCSKVVDEQLMEAAYS